MPSGNVESKKACYVFGLIFVFLILSGAAVRAVGVRVSNFAVPYSSYTYDFWGEAVPAPHAYLPSLIIKGTDLGVGDFSAPSDLIVSEDGNIYIADAGNNRILIFDPNWKLLQTIETFMNNGVEDSFARPQGIFVTEDGSLYVADTGQTRIVQFDAKGQLVRVIGPPRSDVEGVLPNGFDYRPLKVGVDLHDRIYVISQDLPEGLISFSEDGQFRGFLGAPKVTPNLADYIWSRIATREQRARMQVFLPTEYSNFDLDPNGFIYATTTDEDQDEDTGEKRDRVKMLNAKGEDLLRRLGFSPPVGDVQYPDQNSNATRRRASRLVDITVHDFGVYSVLDSNRGRVFTYDNNGNLLYMFGYRGTDYGQMMQPVALDSYQHTMFVLDAQQNSILLFEPTDYALLIWAALDAYNRGDYVLTEALWRKVLELNGNYDLAYTGIGRTLLRRELYGEAMHFFELGNNRAEYSDAFGLYRRGVIYAQFSKGFLVFLAIGLALLVGRKVFGKGRSSAVVQTAATTADASVISRTYSSLKYGLHCLFHPNEGFYQLKYGHKGTVPAATIIVGLVVAAVVFSRQYTGFIFNTLDLTRLSLPLEIASVVVPFLLWAAVNWALTTLMEGKGSFRDIYIATAFALVPLILFIFPLTILSNYITAEEGTFYYFFMVLGVLWAAVLVIFGAVMTTHEYDFAKTIWTCLLTIAGMAFAMFLGFLFINLSEQVFNFINEIIVELMYRT